MTVSDNSVPELTAVNWAKSYRNIRAVFPPIDLFEDIADPSDWEALLSAEMKTNPRLAESVGNLDTVPKERRVAGQGASWVMAPFTHYSPDRPSRFSNGTYGVYYAGNKPEVALFETVYHHEKFMAATQEKAGWTSAFRQLIRKVQCHLYNIREKSRFHNLYQEDYKAAQILAGHLRQEGANGLIYKSVRYEGGEAVVLFWPDCISLPVQGDDFSYHWDGKRVDKIHNLTQKRLFRIV